MAAKRGYTFSLFTAMVITLGAILAGCFSNNIADSFQNPRKPGLYVFVSSAAASGDMSEFSSLGCSGTGVGNADCACQALASSGGLVSGDVSFRAFLSSDSSDAICRVLGKSGKAEQCLDLAEESTSPYYRPDRVKVAEGVLDLYKNGAAFELNVDEGGLIQQVDVWTGSNSQGTSGDGAGGTFENCANWSDFSNTNSGVVGNSIDVGGWANKAITSCDLNNHIYCFELP